MGWKSKKDGTHFNTDKTVRSSEPDTEVNIEIDNNSEEFSEGVRKDFADDVIYYRGYNPDDVRKISTGNKLWDDNLFVSRSKENAMNYGHNIIMFKPKPDARILVEGSKEFRNIIRKPKNHESIFDYYLHVLEKAKQYGYDIIEFERQGDVGTLVINRESVIPV